MPLGNSPLIINVQPVGSQMPGIDPFIFGAYHEDKYPKGNGKLGPDANLLAGRDIGMDFSRQDGWSMYHGETIPGFPAHPHRGFETVTIVRKGLVDHADSLGATARYGEGDVQWLTTGRGVQHGEMFPLVHEDKNNTLDLFQIWLNLPAKNKMVPPDFTMFWANEIPRVIETDTHGRRSEIEIIAGNYMPVYNNPNERKGMTKALPPPINSWASEPTADVAIWIIRLEPGASVTLPPASKAARRAIYLTTGSSLSVDGENFTERVMVEVRPEFPAPLQNNGTTTMELLLLQGKPIGEPVVARGPFVMNSQAELTQAINDFHRTQFGGWPWPSHGHTHEKSERFAQHPDGRIEKPSA